MIYTKEQFCKSMYRLIHGLERMQTFENSINEFNCGSFNFTGADDLINGFIETLSYSVVNDPELIEWWLYESVEKKIYIKEHSPLNPCDKELIIDVSTPELLYDYIVKYSNESQPN